MHMIPQLRKLERRFAKELAVVGVHSGKFTLEKDLDSVRDAVRRYDIDHPVVNDPDYDVWTQYTVQAWPTLMMVDPTGKVIAKHEGEIRTQIFEPLVAKMIASFDAEGLIDRRELQFTREQAAAGELAYPGKVIADPSGRRLFVADSNHDRVVVTGLDGKIQRVIGSGRTGFKDGTLGDAELARPQGLALDGDVLYVADLENHAIRRVDLASGAITTLAGTGEQSRTFHQGGPGLKTQLNSPWDILLAPSPDLLVAMAGFHQLWSLDLVGGEVRPYAGNGREGIVDGPLPDAWLAQPTGLATDGERIFFADSETSAIRLIEPDTTPRVRSLVGAGLFDFGDEDGFGEQVRLQHAQGLVWHGGVLYVADTYNNKIKQLDPVTRFVTHLFGAGRHGQDDGPAKSATFREPSGLAALDGKLYVADTNNHAIRVADLATGEVTTLDVR